MKRNTISSRGIFTSKLSPRNDNLSYILCTDGRTDKPTKSECIKLKLKIDVHAKSLSQIEV